MITKEESNGCCLVGPVLSSIAIWDGVMLGHCRLVYYYFFLVVFDFLSDVWIWHFILELCLDSWIGFPSFGLRMRWMYMFVNLFLVMHWIFDGRSLNMSLMLFVSFLLMCLIKMHELIVFISQNIALIYEFLLCEHWYGEICWNIGA